jgi:hypothetical protein
MANGTLKVGTLTTSSGSGNITIGSGVTLNSNTPAFSARLSANQSLSNATLTKVQYDIEEFDTDNCYDTSNYRFTIPSNGAGKYLISFSNYLKAESLTAFNFGDCELRKNGTKIDDSFVDLRSGGDGHQFQIGKTHFLDLADGDYFEVFARINVSSGNLRVEGDTSQSLSVFMGMKIGA